MKAARYYSLKTPCSNCPFLKVGGIRVRPGRAEELARAATDAQGSSFTCHKTTVCVEDANGDSDMVAGPNARQCAGALLFALNQEQLNQGMRIAERLGVWKPDEMTGHELVFEDLDAMWDANCTGGKSHTQDPRVQPEPPKSYQVLKAELKKKILKGKP